MERSLTDVLVNIVILGSSEVRLDSSTLMLGYLDNNMCQVLTLCPIHRRSIVFQYEHCPLTCSQILMKSRNSPTIFPVTIFNDVCRRLDNLSADRQHASVVIFPNTISRSHCFPSNQQTIRVCYFDHFGCRELRIDLMN